MVVAEGADQYVPYDPLTGKIRSDWPSTVKESAALLRTAAAAVFVENRGTFSRGRDVLVEALRDGRVRSLAAYTFEVLGIGAAIENMWLAAISIGLAATFMGDVLIVEAGIRERLRLEGDLVGALALGYQEMNDASTHRDVDPNLALWHEG